MSKTYQAMLAAIAEKRNWQDGSLRVEYRPEVRTPTLARIEHSVVYLHDEPIARVVHETGQAVADVVTLAKWPDFPAATKLLRTLRALGVDVDTGNQGMSLFIDGYHINHY